MFPDIRRNLTSPNIPSSISVHWYCPIVEGDIVGPSGRVIVDGDVVIWGVSSFTFSTKICTSASPIFGGLPLSEACT